MSRCTTSRAAAAVTNHLTRVCVLEGLEHPTTMNTACGTGRVIPWAQRCRPVRGRGCRRSIAMKHEPSSWPRSMIRTMFAREQAGDFGLFHQHVDELGPLRQMGEDALDGEGALESTNTVQSRLVDLGGAAHRQGTRYFPIRVGVVEDCTRGNHPRGRRPERARDATRGRGRLLAECAPSVRPGRLIPVRGSPEPEAPRSRIRACRATEPSRFRELCSEARDNGPMRPPGNGLFADALGL